MISKNNPYLIEYNIRMGDPNVKLYCLDLKQTLLKYLINQYPKN